VANKKDLKGYLGGSYEKLGLWDNEKDAEIGIVGGEYLHELLSEYDGKFVKITIEETLPDHIIDEWNSIGCTSFDFTKEQLEKMKKNKADYLSVK